MTRNKGKLRIFVMLLAVVLCMTAFSTVAYAGGGDYYDSELPPETTEPEESADPTPTVEPGEPFTEDGAAATRDLLYDKHTNKQFITVETRNGHTLYIVIDYDKLLDEEEERYQTYFLNPVDEADLLALLEDEDGNSPITCSCTEKCTAGNVNTDCALCKNDMTNCAGKEAATAEPEVTEPPEETETGGGMGGVIALVLIMALAGGAAVWYFKFRKPKASVKGNDDLDEFEFDDDDEDEEADAYGDADEPDALDAPEDEETEDTEE